MIVLSVVGTYDLIITQGFPDSDWPTISSWLPTWDWWAWVILFLILVLIAVIEGAYRSQKNASLIPAGSELDNQLPEKLSLEEQITNLVGEGEEIRRIAVLSGEPPPEANASHWRTKVESILMRNYDLDWVNSFNIKYREGNPEHKFSGIGMTNQIELWKKLQAGIEWLRDFLNQIKDT